MSTVKIKTRLIVDKVTPNNNIYTRECLERMVDSAHESMREGPTIFVYRDISSKLITDVIGTVMGLELVDGRVDIEVYAHSDLLGDIHPDHYFLNTRVYVEMEDIKDNIDTGVKTISKAVLDAVSICVDIEEDYKFTELSSRPIPADPGAVVYDPSAGDSDD